MAYRPLSCPRVAAVGFPVAAACLLLIGSATPARADQELAINGCNSQQLANGSTIFWTSSFSTDTYVFENATQDTRTIATGDGETAIVNVRWGIIDPEVGSVGSHDTPRGAGFTPSGVSGSVSGGPALFVVEEIEGCPISDDELIGFEAGTAGYTLDVVFTSLHRPERRGGGVASGVAKGSAHRNVFVNVGVDQVALSVNVHVATAPDPDEG